MVRCPVCGETEPDPPAGSAAYHRHGTPPNHYPVQLKPVPRP